MKSRTEKQEDVYRRIRAGRLSSIAQAERAKAATTNTRSWWIDPKTFYQEAHAEQSRMAASPFGGASDVTNARNSSR